MLYTIETLRCKFCQDQEGRQRLKLTVVQTQGRQLNATFLLFKSVMHLQQNWQRCNQPSRLLYMTKLATRYSSRNEASHPCRGRAINWKESRERIMLFHRSKQSLIKLSQFTWLGRTPDCKTYSSTYLTFLMRLDVRNSASSLMKLHQMKVRGTVVACQRACASTYPLYGGKS